MSKLTCFDSVTLQDYLLGKLPDEQSDVISTHLERCLSCEATISQLDRASDTLTNGLRLEGAASTSLPASDADLRQVLSRVQSLEPASESLSNSSGQNSTPSLSNATLLRDYRLLEPIGSGGMGQVFKAVHTRLDRLVAVKLLPARRLGDEQAVARFQREMRVIGQLSHPAIVQATDAGEVDGTHFLVMEYVEGHDLNTIAKSCGLLTVADACEIARQAAVGLEYAHQQGIVHRDIKPSNLMLSGSAECGARSAERGTAVTHSALRTPHSPLLKILDLGLALLSGEQAPVDELTTVGQLMGTLDYMAPEQLEDSHLVGPRADIYALAATLFRLLTGFAPFAKDDRKTPLQKLRALATLSAPPIRERRADLPEELATIIDRALRRDQAERFASMTEFATALAPWCAGHELAALAQRADRLTQPVADQGCSLPGSLSPWERVGVREPSVSRRDRASQTLRSEPSAVEQHRSSDRIPHPSPLPEGEGTGRRAPRRRLFTTLAFLILAAFGIVITIETNKGKLIIESVRDGVEVRVKKSGREVEKFEVSKTAKSTKLSAGEYEIELVGEADGLKIDQQKVVVMRGDVVVAKVVEVPKGQEVADAISEMTKPGTGRISPNPSGIPEVPIQVADDSPTEPADEKPNPQAKSIDQWFAENPDGRSEAKFRETMRRKIDLDFADNPLTDVVAFCSDHAGIPIWLDATALTEEGIATDTPVTFLLNGSSLESALVLMLRPLQLTHSWDGTSVRITTLTKSKERLVNRMYPIGRSLPMVRKAVRLANEQSLAAHNAILQKGGMPVRGPVGSGGGMGGGGQQGGGGFFQVPEVDLTSRLHFQFGGGGGGGGGHAGVNGAYDHNGLFHPLQTQTVVGEYSRLLGLMTSSSWQLTDGEGGTIQLVGDVLIVRQTQPVHDQVISALRLLEQAAAGPLPQSPAEIRRTDYPLAADELLRKKLSQPAELNMNDTPLTDAIGFLEDSMQVRILLDLEKLTDEGIASDSPVTLSLKDVPFQVVLRRLLEPLQLAANIEEGVLIVTTKAAVLERPSLKTYDVRDLLGRGVEQKDLIDALFATTDSWVETSGEGGELMIFAERVMFVTQSQPNHAEIEEVLRLLRSQLSDQLPKTPLAKRFPRAPAGTTPPQPAPAPAPANPQPKANTARYDGKTFDEWFAIIDTERSPARLGDAIEALKLLGPEADSAKVSERLLSLTRTIDLGPDSYHSNAMNGLRGKLFEYFIRLTPDVSQKAFANELRSGTSRSQLFILSGGLAIGDSVVSEELVTSILSTCRSSDLRVRRAAVLLLESLKLDQKLAKFDSQRLGQFRTSLNDADPQIALRAAKNLLDSEPDALGVAAAMARIVAKPGNTSQRMEALNLIAILGPRAASVAPQVANLLLEKTDGYVTHTAHDVRLTNFDAVHWLGTFREDSNATWQLAATVALARMGKGAAAALPKIDEALKTIVPATKPSSSPVEKPAGTDFSDASLDQHFSWHELLQAARTRIEAPAAIDLRGNDLKVLEKAVQLAAWHRTLLAMEQSLLMQYRSRTHESVVALTGPIETAAVTFHELSELKKNRNAFLNSNRKEFNSNVFAVSRIKRLEDPTWGTEVRTHFPTGLVVVLDSPRVIAIKELGSLGPAARDALPQLKKELESKDEATVVAAKQAIVQIEAVKADETK